MNRTRWILVTFALPWLAVCAFAGCGDSRDTVQVSGRVHYKGGAPLDGAARFIRFQPTDESPAKIRKAASAEIAPDGTFELYTRKPGDGVFPGRYAVNFTVFTSYTNGKSLIDPKYESAETTPYIVDVTEDMSDLVYELEKRM